MDIEKSHTDLLYALSDGKKSDMDAWRGSPVQDVYMGLWIHQDRIKERLKYMEEQQNKAKNSAKRK